LLSDFNNIEKSITLISIGTELPIAEIYRSVFELIWQKVKYTKETTYKILEAIARDGYDEFEWLTGGISEITFYQWQDISKNILDTATTESCFLLLQSSGVL
jgi:hypothetical protein